MAKNVSFENIAHAKVFIDKFGFAEINVDDLDCFLIDRKLATDPNTTNTKSVAYKGFVQQRSAGIRLLNNAGTWVNNGQSFQIDVKEPGKTYTIKKWVVNSREFGNEVGNRVRDYSENRQKEFDKLRRQAEVLLAEDPDNTEMVEVTHLLTIMRVHGIQMHAKIRGIVTQYNDAADATAAYIRGLIENKEEDKKQLPSPNKNED